MRKGGGVGFLLVLITAAIVLILAARNWTAVAPTAQQVLNPAEARKAKDGRKRAPAIADHGDPQAAAALADLPDLQDMKDATDAHAREVAKAAADSNR
jgi:hypothetical protein